MDKKTPQIVKDYMEFLRNSRKIQPQTIKAYSYDILLFLKYFKMRLIAIHEATLNNIDIYDVDIRLLSKISIVDIIAFMNYISNNRKNGYFAKARKISSINSFFNYLVNTKRYLDHNPCNGLEIPKEKNKSTQQLREDDALLLVNDLYGKHPLRDKAIILLFVYSGLQLHELINIKLEDLDLENHSIIIKQKNHEVKEVLLNNQCTKSIYAYLQNERINTNCNFLFLSQRKIQISIRTIQHLIKTHRDKNPHIQNKISSQILRNTITSQR